MQSNDQPTHNFLKYLQVTLLLGAIFYFGKVLFVPLFFGLLTAIVLHPISKWLEQRGWNKVMAITACLLIVSLLIAGLLVLFVWQIKLFSKDAPAIVEKLSIALQNFRNWLSENINITAETWNEQYDKLLGSAGGTIKSVIQNTASTLFMLFLVPVYTALFMYHRGVFVAYLKEVTGSQYQLQLDNVVNETIHTYSRFIRGMVMVYLIVGILNSIGLFALGVRNPVLFGMLCAIMTIIPYIGIAVSSLLPISVIWLDKENIWYPIGVVAVFGFVQYLEANVIFPRVVGAQLKVSTFAILVAAITGGIIWGVAGMVLFIPFAAILKIASDHIDGWKPLNILLGRK